jgi:glycosyltransferase involved in cell wall biosynthesis
MKLAIVTRAFPPDVISGRETVIYNLWRQAVQCDEVALISGWLHGPSHLPAFCHPIDQSSASRIINYARFFLQSSRLIRRIQPDVVLSNAIELGRVACPSAVIVHDFNFGRADSRRGSQILRHLAIDGRLRSFKHVIAVSRFTADQLGSIGLSDSRISVIHNGVDLDRFHPIPPTAREHLLIVCPARITPGKGHHIALKILRRLDEGLRAKARLLIVGYVEDEEYLSQLKAAAADLPVEFHTNVAEIAPYYQSADVVVFPTLMEEGFGFTAAEAMACGKPVIHSAYAAIIEATGGIGISVPPGDIRLWAQALASLLQDAQRRRAMEEAGLSFAQAHYNWTDIYRQYRRVLQVLSAGGRER